MKKVSQILLVLIFALAATTSFAKKEKECPGHPSCGNGGGGEDPPTLPISEVNNEAKYTAGISETPTGLNTDWNVAGGLPRFCELDFLQPTNGTSSYACASGGTLSYDFDLSGDGWQNTKHRGQQAYCDVLTAFMADGSSLEITPTEYHYVNNSPCTSGSCEFGVHQWSYRGDESAGVHPFHGIPGLEDIGLISIWAYADGVPSTTYLNQFAEDRLLAIHTITFDLRAAGKNKTLAMCEISSSDGDFTLGDVIFDTKVIPQVQ